LQGEIIKNGKIMSTATAKIDTSRLAGRGILRQVSENPHTEKFEIPDIARDENGVPLGISVDEYCDRLRKAISEHYRK
jgi:hypothetical protein